MEVSVYRGTIRHLRFLDYLKTDKTDRSDRHHGMTFVKEIRMRKDAQHDA